MTIHMQTDSVINSREFHFSSLKKWHQRPIQILTLSLLWEKKKKVSFAPKIILSSIGLLPYIKNLCST